MHCIIILWINIVFTMSKTMYSSRIKKQTTYHLLFYCTYCRLNMFRALLCPSLAGRGYNVDYHIGRFVLGLL